MNDIVIEPARSADLSAILALLRDQKLPVAGLTDHLKTTLVARKGGQIVGSVADGKAVLEAAQRLQPDVIVLDLNLPNVHGLEACRQIRQGHPTTKVIVFTAMNDPDLRQQCLEVGASAFLFKGDGDLVSTIKRLCVIE